MAGRLANAFAALVLSILLALFISTGILGVPSRVSRLLRVLPNATRVEPQFTTDFSFIIHWASAWDDYSALRDAPLGDILADLVEALDQHQNPVDCAKVSYLIFEYRTALGFGSQIRHIIAAFYTALQTDRVFVLSDGLSFYWANGCPDKANNRRFICHFRPLSQTCPFSRVKKLIDGGRIPVF
ncbi:hypothetical protein BWQ96_07043 [Gracilariopsis chorda]|uniref:Alpha-(1,6)-fucosyltransferase N- and catalytic domain-containing protein n=1 Tax=Gracilariopsis chorda TaxID=448386 RepID=A0A2V3IMA3_9FLOR|nr:hypothetical protein BWQ96_07043 [Gracilariopsis chorda]|eukprot:PXF43214.1 hypothetical protein BWQ96_07043 [Gracilariopsis chorda]